LPILSKIQQLCNVAKNSAPRWRANLRILEIDEIQTVPRVPLSHPFVARLIGTMRREFLDHVLFWNGRDLERELAEFQTYYNAARSHGALEGRTPLTFADRNTVTPVDLTQMRWVSHCRDVVQLPVAAWQANSRPTRTPPGPSSRATVAAHAQEGRPNHALTQS